MFQCSYLQLRYQHHTLIYHQMLELLGIGTCLRVSLSNFQGYVLSTQCVFLFLYLYRLSVPR